MTLGPPMSMGSRNTQKTSYAKLSGKRMHATCAQASVSFGVLSTSQRHYLHDSFTLCTINPCLLHSSKIFSCYGCTVKEQNPLCAPPRL